MHIRPIFYRRKCSLEMHRTNKSISKKYKHKTEQMKVFLKNISEKIQAKANLCI